MIRSYKIHVANKWSAKSFFRTFLAMPWLCQSEFFIQPWQHCSLVNSDSPFWRVQRAQSNTIQISHEILSYILSKSCFAFFEHSYILIHIIHTIYMCALYTCLFACTIAHWMSFINETWFITVLSWFTPPRFAHNQTICWWQVCVVVP